MNNNEQNKAKPKVVYLHGLASSGSSNTARLLRTLLPEADVIAPDITVDSVEAMTMLKELGKTLPADTIIVGTSMGAFYTQMMHGWRRILVNPSFHTSDVILRPNFGNSMPYLQKRLNGDSHYDITEQLCKDVEYVEAHQFDTDFGVHGPLPESADLVQAYFGDNDTTVNCRDEYLTHYYKFDIFKGTHQLDPNTIENIIVPQIRKLLSTPL